MTFNPLSKVVINDGANLDAFNRLRVSQPSAFFDAKMHVGILGNVWIQSTSSATIAASNQCAATLSMTAALGTAILQTKRRGIYQPGRSLLALVTFNLNVDGNGTANVRKRVGMFDENDGVYLEQNGTDVRFVLRTNTTGTPSDTNAVTKASWNLDTFDGTGVSGITLDFSKPQIMIADLEWLGVGRVRVGFVVDGVIHYAHQFLNANATLLVPYMANPNLPVRYECVATSGTPTASMLAVCCTILSEGGFDTVGRLNSFYTPVAGRSLGAVREELMAIRLGSNFIRKGMLFPEGLAILQVTQAFRWEIVLNPTLTGTVNQGSWVAVSNSIAEYNLTRTSTTAATGGDVIASGLVSSSVDSYIGSLASALPVAQLDLTPTSDILSLMIETLNNSDQTYNGALTWRDVH